MQEPSQALRARGIILPLATLPPSFIFPFADCVVLLRWCLIRPRLMANSIDCGGWPRTSDILASAVAIIALYHRARLAVLEIKPKALCLLERRFYQPSHMPSL